MSNSVILLSGGIDSAALAFWKKPELAITINYGQASAPGEIRAAKQIALELKMPHEVLSVDCSQLGSGDLASRPPHKDAPASEWWPFRNQFLITVAGMRAIAADADAIILGSVSSDAFHADGTEDFYSLMDSVMSTQEGHLAVQAPAIHMTSVELVRKSRITLDLLGWTHSCHRAEFACGFCRGCTKHREVMSEVGYGNSQT